MATAVRCKVAGRGISSIIKNSFAGNMTKKNASFLKSPGYWQNRTLFGLSKKKDDEVMGSNILTTKVRQGPEVEEEMQHNYRERFIPITRKSLIRHIMQDDKFLTDTERRKFEDFALSLDSAIVNRYHGILQELKLLFDPINPDKDTLVTRRWNRRERLDNEFWLLQKLADIMEKANFHELPKSLIGQALAEHSTREGVLVSVNPDKYDVMRYWALGKDTPLQRIPWYQWIYNKLTGKPAPAPISYYKRVVVAVRMKRDEKLMLKIFKEVPVNALEQLLPDGKIRMSRLDRGIILSSVSIVLLGVLAKVVSVMAHYQIQWTLILSTVTCLVGIRAWTVYKNRRNAYLVDLSRMLYYKNVANNRGLLTLLVDRAEDESFKEALLTYSFLLAAQKSEVPMPTPSKGMVTPSEGSNESLPAEIGGLTQLHLENQIESWVSSKVSGNLEFESDEAVKILQQFGILSRSDDYLKVLPVVAAMRNLPQEPHSVIARAQEFEIVEGYDKEAYDETEKQYKEEDAKTRKIGWG